MDRTDHPNTQNKDKTLMNTKSLENTIQGASQKIENEITHLKVQIKQDSLRQEALTSKMHQLQQQSEIYSHECQVVMERIKDSNWSFTKELSLTLLKMKKPTPEILDLSDKFMILLEQKEVNWKMFQASLRNYDSLKALMDKFNPETIKEENVDLIMTLWKNYNSIQPKISKVSRAASILLDWITACMEYKIKKATLDGIKKSLSDVQNRTKEYNNSVAEKKSLVATLEEKLKEIKENGGQNINSNNELQQGPPVQMLKKVNRKSNSNLRPRNSQSGANPKEQKEEITTNTTSTSHVNNNTNTQQNTNMNSSKAVSKLSKMLAPSLSNIQANEMAKKLEQQGEEREQSMSMNASCDIRNESVQVNTIFLSTYRFPLNFGNGYLTRIEEGNSTASRRSSKVGKILAIISNHDDRNKDNLVLSDSKIMFAKEKNSNTTSANKNENNLLEGNSLDMKPHLLEEDKTNSTYLNSVRNHLYDQPNVRKKLFSTIGNNSGASIGMNSQRHDDSTHRSNTTRKFLTPRITDDDINNLRMENNSNLNSARSKRYEFENDKPEEDNVADDESFAGCCKKGINRLFCS